MMPRYWGSGLFGGGYPQQQPPYGPTGGFVPPSRASLDQQQPPSDKDLGAGAVGPGQLPDMGPQTGGWGGYGGYGRYGRGGMGRYGGSGLFGGSMQAGGFMGGQAQAPYTNEYSAANRPHEQMVYAPGYAPWEQGGQGQNVNYGGYNGPMPTMQQIQDFTRQNPQQATGIAHGLATDPNTGFVNLNTYGQMASAAGQGMDQTANDMAFAKSLQNPGQQPSYGQQPQSQNPAGMEGVGSNQAAGTPPPGYNFGQMGHQDNYYDAMTAMSQFGAPSNAGQPQNSVWDNAARRWTTIPQGTQTGAGYGPGFR